MTIEIVELLQSFQNGFLDFFFNAISFLGEQYVYILILAIVYYAYDKKLGEFLSFSLFFAGVFNNTLKLLINAPRPFQKYPSRVNNLRPSTSTGHSFPSGHTQNFATFLYAEAFHSKKRNIFIVATILAILMGLSRIYLGVHFLEDVVVAVLLGILSAYVLNKIFKKVSEHNLHRIYFGIIIFFTPFVFLLGEADLYKSYGLMIGFTFAMIYEKKYVHFTLNVSALKKGIRISSGLVIMLAIQLGLGTIFDSLAEEGSTLLYIFDMIRYFLIAFIGLGVYPKLFKKFNF